MPMLITPDQTDSLCVADSQTLLEEKPLRKKPVESARRLTEVLQRRKLSPKKLSHFTHFWQKSMKFSIAKVFPAKLTVTVHSQRANKKVSFVNSRKFLLLKLSPLKYVWQ